MSRNDSNYHVDDLSPYAKQKVLLGVQYTQYHGFNVFNPFKAPPSTIYGDIKFSDPCLTYSRIKKQQLRDDREDGRLFKADTNF